MNAARSRHRHVAAARDAHGPVGEPVGRIERTHDVARAHDRRARAVGIAHVLLAERLHRPVTLVRDFLFFLVREHAGRRADVVCFREARVRRDARDIEAVVGARAEQVGRHLAELRDVARVVHDRIPVPAFQGVELTLAVAVQRLDVLDAVRVALAAIEVRDLPAARKRLFGHVRSDESGTAQDQERAGGVFFGHEPACGEGERRACASFQNSATGKFHRFLLSVRRRARNAQASP
jgi:hypothetical protein